jgi:hypothetical protein
MVVRQLKVGVMVAGDIQTTARTNNAIEVKDDPGATA